MTRFREFVHSPYFNKHRDVRALTQYLDSCYPEFSAFQCDRYRVYKKVFPRKAHDQGKLAVVFTYTYRLAEQFLAQEMLRSGEAETNHLLLRGMRQVKAFELYQKVLDRSGAQLENAGEQSSTHWWHRYQMASERDYFLNHIIAKRDLSGLNVMEEQLDRFYLAEKLKNAVEAQVRRNMVKVETESRMLDSAVREVAENLEVYRNIPAIYLYYKLFEMLREKDHRHYYEALQELKSGESCFPPPERASLYNYFQNYCIREINQNNLEFLQELFRLYQSQLEQELLLEEGYLSEWHYKNIVTVGLRLEELDWVHEFIRTYRDRLRPEVADNAYRFNLAAYYHEAKVYGKVLDLLIKVEYRDPRYNLGAKALLLRTYYELEEDEALYSLVDSFLQYLQRNQKMSDARREGFYHLFRMTRRAAHIRSRLGYDKKEKTAKDLDRLKRELETTGGILNQSWLEAKMDEIAKYC
ncbi:hypothetical protein [Flavilitoribacter nigricans]|nr:hypothetical protein [Flavilitoribacter nigricans]